MPINLLTPANFGGWWGVLHLHIRRWAIRPKIDSSYNIIIMAIITSSFLTTY